MVSSVRTGSVAALLVVFAVVLAAAAVPMLSGHTPLDVVGPDVDGLGAGSGEFETADDPQDIESVDDIERDEGLIHEDFASMADDDLAETMSELAGLLALLFGADGLEGAVGGSSEQQDPDQAETDEDEGTDSDDTDADTDEQSGEDASSDDELAGADTDDPEDDSSDDDAAGSESDASGDESDSLFAQLDLLTVGLIVGSLLAVAVGWIAYRTGRSVVAIVLSIPTLLLSMVTRFVFGITALVERVVRAIRTTSSVFALPGLFVAGIVQSWRNIVATVRSLFNRGQPAVDAGSVEQLPSEREQIRSAWRSVIDVVDDTRYRRRTPGEIKQQAIDRGLPEPPVSTLLGLFRDVEYGAKDPTDRASQAVSAATELSEAGDTVADDASTSTRSTEGTQ